MNSFTDHRATPAGRTLGELKAELAIYGKTVEDWFRAFPITAATDAYSADVHQIAAQLGWKRI